MKLSGTFGFAIRRGCPHCSYVLCHDEVVHRDLFENCVEAGNAMAFIAEEMRVVTDNLEVVMTNHIASDHVVKSV